MFVTIVEVGPRDGLQNEKGFVTTEKKIELVNRLNETGLSCVEVTSFVSPKWIPQFSDAEKVYQECQHLPGIRYPALVPNEQGLLRALACGVNEVAVFIAASETFSQKNTNCSIADSLERIKPVIQKSKKAGVRTRAYISCVFGCPYEGDIEISAVSSLCQSLENIAVDEISLGDTIGVAYPEQVIQRLQSLKSIVSVEKLALHLHNTFGRAISNIEAGLSEGVKTFDSSIAGLGGCPYAKGATGNVATEEVIKFLHEKGYETGIDLEKIFSVKAFVEAEIRNR